MEPAIDEALYNRQMYVVGVEAMKKMSSTKILVSGLTGLGCEIAKNLILSGVKSVALHDDVNTSSFDLSSNFYLSVTDIGKPRAEACLSKLSELNQYVEVGHLKGDLSHEILSQFQVVVFVDQSFSRLVDISNFCHEKGIKFLCTETHGVAGMVFCDFGKDFQVNDPDGEEPVTCLITAITSSNPAAITVHDENRHNLQDGDLVSITDVDGPASLNGKQWTVTVTGPFTFTIDADATSEPAYVRGGYVKPVKRSIVQDFKSLEESIVAPQFLEDFTNLSNPQQLHLLFRALHEFEGKHNRKPKPQNVEEAAQVVEIAQKIKVSEKTEVELNTEKLTALARVSSGVLNPIAAFFGGFAAQEVLKASSGKFSPLHQWFYFDSVETLPKPLPCEEDCAPENSRYDGQIAVFGKSFQQKLLEHHNFLVGAGALGCELLKNFAMMGLGCSHQGEIVVTDLDTIEKSNLSRQFLFRTHHIGKEKSRVASEQAKLMNPQLNIKSLTDKVEAEVFDDDFWESLDGVTNALDNINSRLYVDSKCVYYRKPLMESGTLGTKCNVQVVSPFLTESYASSRDPPEKQIPVCTLKNFPNAIEHTIQWARDSFEGLFTQAPSDANAYITKPDFLKQLEKDPSSRITTLENIHDLLVKNRPKSFEDCVRWARLKFDEYFNHLIQQMLHNFPVDTVTSTGQRFWSGPKRPPTPLVFDPEDEAHVDFINSAARLRAFVFGIEADPSFNIASFAFAVETLPFQPRKVNIPVDENDKQQGQENPDASRNVGEIVSRLPPPTEFTGTLSVVEFEKDDDRNFHIDFITACSNLRARNYKIPEADRSKTKMIAGKIIPAMVTTTSLVTGLVCLEWYKLIQNKSPEHLRNAFVNLALPLVTQSEPLPPKSAEYGKGKKWTLWDRFDIDEKKDITLQEFIRLFEDRHELEVSMISSGSSIIYSFFGAKDKLQQRLKKPISEVVKEVTKSDFLPTQKYVNMEVCCSYKEEDVDVPYVRYKFR